MADNDAQPTNTEEDRPAEAYLDSLDYVWDVEEFRDWDVDEEDPLAELDSTGGHWSARRAGGGPSPSMSISARAAATWW